MQIKVEDCNKVVIYYPYSHVTWFRPRDTSIENRRQKKNSLL